MKTVTASHKERYQFRTLTGYEEIVIHLSGAAGEWLAGTTRTTDGYVVGNRTLFCDLLSRMEMVPVVGLGFRRPQSLNAGQAQYSELQLQAEWGIGRKVIRRLLDEMEQVDLIKVEKSTVASTLTFPCIRSWRLNDLVIVNPYHYSFYTGECIEVKGGLK
jgi:hypothetical protein